MEEETLPTPCEKIKIFTGNGLPSAGMEPYLEALRHICERRDVPGLVLTLKDLIPDYNPSAQLLRRIVDLPKTAVTAAPRAKAAAAYATDTEPGSRDHDRSVRDMAQGMRVDFHGGAIRWANDGLAEDRRRARRLRLELPVHIRWRDG